MMREAAETGANLGPRMVTIYELREKLLPLMDGVPGSEDCLMDLWRMGAPDPNSRTCPPGGCLNQVLTGNACGKWGCAMEKRVLLPTQFATWWQDVARRQGLSLTEGEVLNFGPAGRKGLGEKGHR